MKKPIIGIIQLLLMVVAFIAAATVFFTFYGIVIWFIDLVWALIVGILWYSTRKSHLN